MCTQLNCDNLQRHSQDSVVAPKPDRSSSKGHRDSVTCISTLKSSWLICLRLRGNLMT